MGAVNWQSLDMAAFSKILNDNASDFAGVEFDGWHVLGDEYTPPGVDPLEATPPGEPDNVVAFGRIYPGAVVTGGYSTPDHDDEPTREGLLSLELHAVRGIATMWPTIFDAALLALSQLAPAGVYPLMVLPQTWVPPGFRDIPGSAFPSFRAVAGAVSYTD